MKYWGILFLLFLSLTEVLAQARLNGKIIDEEGKVLPAASLAILNQPNGATTNQQGIFTIVIPSDTTVTLLVSYLGFEKFEQDFFLKKGESKNIDIQLKRKSQTFKEFEVKEEQTRTSTFTKIDPLLIDQLPSPSGNLESILFTLPGVVSTNELSSQYSVRGGNFDENLIYVNDVLIYRPFLVRSGQMEGLSFINSDMVSAIQFSAGGFDARYGDKMSSVLDVEYKKPTEFGGSVTASLLGAQLFIQDASKDYRFKQIHGFRYRTNQYLLNALDNQGDYQPNFTDYQGYFTFDVTDRHEIGALVNYAQNSYRFVPETRSTDFGTVNEALRLTIFFAGQEITEFQTLTGALFSTHQINNNLKLKFIASSYRSLEDERFDVEGAYRLDQLEQDLGSEDFGDIAFNRGVGSYLNYGRNFLDAWVSTVEHKGEWRNGDDKLFWGVSAQHEWIEDRLNEWRLIDSVGFSIPYRGNEVNLFEVIKANNSIRSNRYNAYTQYSGSFGTDSSFFTYNLGLRVNHWDFNNQTLVSPRASISWQPNWKKDILFRAAWGFYYQPPFYREMRDLFGTVNNNIRAQQSIHYVVGLDYNFKMFDRPFKLTAEAYYKQLNHLIPYEIENVRLRYYAENNAIGYARGLDFRLNGEWIPGVDSWISLGVMDTKEDLTDDFFYHYFNAAGDRIIPGFTFDQVAVDSTRFEPGYIPRPTDQRVTFGLFLQDYLPRNPTFKVNLNMIVGTGLPFGPPTFERYKDTLRIPPYRRVDVGFSKQLIGNGAKKFDNGFLSYVKSMWISLEVFNLLQVNNTISYLWIRDVNNRQYAVPNYLTNRQVNLRLITKF